MITVDLQKELRQVIKDLKSASNSLNNTLRKSGHFLSTDTKKELDEVNRTINEVIFKLQSVK